MARRVVLAMSGGVDSSVAACLLKEQGYEVIGLFMRTGSYALDEERRAKTCCSVADSMDAQRVADLLDIPFYALDFEREFGRIKDYFVDEYVAGRTPNPCVMCNIWLKFGKLWGYGKQAGADFVATGHYARIARAADGTLRVARARDRAKDQSYVLCGLRSQLLPHVLFPIGDYSKSEIRKIAREHDLPVHDKPESQEICFVPDDDYVSFLRECRPDHDSSGPIVDQDGHVLGTHSGIEAYTIGQRRGSGSRPGIATVCRADRTADANSDRRQPRVARTSRSPGRRDSTGKVPSPLARFPASPRCVLVIPQSPRPWNRFPKRGPRFASIHPRQPSHQVRSWPFTRKTWYSGGAG